MLVLEFAITISVTLPQKEQAKRDWQKASEKCPQSSNTDSRTFRRPQPPVLSQKYCRKNGRRIAVHIGGVLQYKWEVYCWVSLSSRLRSQEGAARIAVQIGGILQYFLDKLYGLRFPEYCPLTCLPKGNH